MTGEFPSTGAIEAMLRTATGDPAPSPEVIRLGMLRLETAMRSEVAAGATRLRPRRWSRAVAVAGLVAAIVVVGTVVIPDEVGALGQLAEVAESVPPVEAGDGTFVYRVSDQSFLATVVAADLGQPGVGDISYLRNVRSRRGRRPTAFVSKPSWARWSSSALPTNPPSTPAPSPPWSDREP